MDKIELREIATIRHGRHTQRADEGKAYKRMTIRDVPLSGFLTTADQFIQMDAVPNENAFVQRNDIVIFTMAPGRLAIIGEVKEEIILPPIFLTIRLHESAFAKKNAIALYMFLKSNEGQELLSAASQTAPRGSRLTANSLRGVKIPIWNDEAKLKFVEKFYNEIKLYGEIANLENRIEMLHMG